MSRSTLKECPINAITMVGAGYVGLVSGACFADFGHQVTCVDKDASKISALQRGKIPIFEPDLDRLVQNNVKMVGSILLPTWQGRYARPTPCLSLSERRRAAATATPI